MNAVGEGRGPHRYELGVSPNARANATVDVHEVVQEADPRAVRRVRALARRADERSLAAEDHRARVCDPRARPRRRRRGCASESDWSGWRCAACRSGG